ncbi:MAG: DUF59 domain-containing protein [Cardiobacteriaceae bacterium]|nr:DUF59 domain-containing protein [Cardiobacteriaceae bacterium]
MEFDEVPYRRDLDDENLPAIEKDIILQLKTVFDPEIPVDIYELGLIYNVSYDENTGIAEVWFSLTAPACPVADSMPYWIVEAVERVDGVDECITHIEWDPPWRMDMMSLEAKIELNMI